MNSKQVRELVAAAKKNNVFLMEVKMKGCSPSGEPYLLFNIILRELKQEIRRKYIKVSIQYFKIIAANQKGKLSYYFMTYAIRYVSIDTTSGY